MGILRKWVQTLPLTGDAHTVGGSATAKKTGLFRVTFIQFSKANALPSENHPTNCAIGQCTNGLLSGRLDELEGDITWHENNYQGTWTYISSALQEVADHTLLPSNSPPWRQRVLLIVIDGVVTDYDGNSCCHETKGCTPACQDGAFDPSYPGKVNAAQTDLRNGGAAVYGVVLRRAAPRTQVDVEAEKRLKPIVSDPRDEHFMNIMMEELLGMVLNVLCDPNSRFGKSLVDPLAGCKGMMDEPTCEASAGCMWAPTLVCENDPCLPLCDEPTCNSDTRCLWNSGCEMKPTSVCTTLPHTCSAGFQLKPAASTTTCPGTPSVCDDVTCCDKLCSTHTCSAGFQLKATPAAIVCTGTPSVCDDATCCDATVKCGTFTCSAMFQDKANKATITCAGMPPVCDDVTCCDATVKCGTFTCSAMFQDKASKTTITCAGMPPVCDDVTCCDATVKCGTFTCSAMFQDKASKATITCAGMPPVCDDVTCCDVTVKCGTFTCSAMFQDKASKTTITCAGMPPVCDDATCCDQHIKCEGFTCSTGFLAKPGKAAALCTGMPPVCADATCCDPAVSCMDFMCTAGYLDKSLKATIVCGADPSDCSLAECCDVSCGHATFSCGVGVLDGRAESIRCGALTTDCTDALCCADVLCSRFICGVGFQDKAGKAALVCGAAVSDCSPTKCCDVLCSNADFSCSGGAKMASAATTLCGGLVSDCKDAACCDIVLCGVHTCGVGSRDKANKAMLMCPGTLVTDCTDAVCCDLEVTCGTYTCRAGKSDKADKASTLCGTALSDCTSTLCCDAACESYTCVRGRLKQPTALCGALPSGCTDGQCCELLCTSHRCGVGFVGKVVVEACPDGGCSDEACCDTTCAHADFACEDGTAKQGADAMTCGATVGNCTQSLCCDALVLAVARDTPTSGLSVKAKERLTLPSNVAWVASVGTANGGKVLVLKSFSCLVQEVDLGEEQPLDWPFHPTRVAIGSALEKYFFGALVFNPLLVVGFALIACAVAYAMTLLMGSPTPRAFGDARTPGVVYLMHTFLLQGTSLVAAQVCFAPGKHSSGVIVLSWFVLLGCVASPAVVYFGVLRRVPVHSEVVSDPAVYGEGEGEESKPGKRANARWYKFLFGTEVWVSKQGYFAEQYGMVYDSLRADGLWYIMAESAAILSLSLLSAFKPASLTTCDIRNFTISVILVAFFLACLLKRPFIAPVDNIATILLSFFLATAVVAMSVALATKSRNDHWLYVVSEWTLFLSTIVITVKAVWDFVQYVVDVALSRSDTARVLARQSEAALDDLHPAETYELLGNDPGDAELVLRPLPQIPSQAAVGAARTDTVAEPAAHTNCSKVSSLMDATLTGHGVVVTASALQPHRATDTDEDPSGASRSSSKRKQRPLRRSVVWV